MSAERCRLWGLPCGDSCWHCNVGGEDAEGGIWRVTGVSEGGSCACLVKMFGAQITNFYRVGRRL